MQIFFDEQIFQKQDRGGVSRYICDLAMALAETGKIKVILFGGYTSNVFLKHVSPSTNLQIIHHHKKNNFKHKGLVKKISLLWRRYSFNKAIRQDPDTIYQPTYYNIDDYIYKNSKATVATVYDMISEVFQMENKHRHWEDKLATVKKADRLMAISLSTKRDMIRFYPFAENKIDIVYLGSTLGKRKEERSIAPFKLDSDYFLMIGKRGGYKNGLTGIRAFEILSRERSDLKLVLCGGSGSEDENEENFVKKYGISQKILRLDADDNTLVSLIRGANALIYPSRYEGFGLPVLEAMQNGCPVITTRLSSIPEVAGDAALYVDPDSPEAISNAMKLMLDKREERQYFVDNGYTQVEQFSMENTALSSLVTYEKALAFSSKRLRKYPYVS